jgi:hypothetical protein
VCLTLRLFYGLVLLVNGLSIGTLEILWDFPWVVALEKNQEPKWDLELEISKFQFVVN